MQPFAQPKAKCINLEKLKKELKEEFLREIQGVNISFLDNDGQSIPGQY